MSAAETGQTQHWTGLTGLLQGTCLTCRALAGACGASTSLNPVAGQNMAGAVGVEPAVTAAGIAGMAAIEVHEGAVR